MAKTDLTAQRLREILHYEPSTGVFIWLALPPKGYVRPGSVAGYLGRTYGYWLIKIKGKKYQAGRLAWLYMTGEWPTGQVDHWDRNRANNRWKNLRDTTHKQNHENLGISSRSLSGVRGVTWDKDRSKWLARIKHNGHTQSLGRHETLEQAIACRLQAERRLFTHSLTCTPLTENHEPLCQQDERQFRAQ